MGTKTFMDLKNAEAVFRSCSVKKGFLKILQIPQESTCSRVSFLIKPCNFIKKRIWHSCFPVNFVKFLRAPFL